MKLSTWTRGSFGAFRVHRLRHRVSMLSRYISSDQGTWARPQGVAPRRGEEEAEGGGAPWAAWPAAGRAGSCARSRCTRPRRSPRPGPAAPAGAGFGVSERELVGERVGGPAGKEKGVQGVSGDELVRGSAGRGGRRAVGRHQGGLRDLLGVAAAERGHRGLAAVLLHHHLPRGGGTRHFRRLAGARQVPQVSQVSRRTGSALGMSGPTSTMSTSALPRATRKRVVGGQARFAPSA
jgi:hypothetical protein